MTLPHVPSPSIAPGRPRTVIAFTGLAGAGKTTAAKRLVLAHGFQRLRFAGPLKAMMAALGLTHEQIDGSEKELPCDLLGGKTPRWAMQTIGTEWGRDLIAKDLWIRAWHSAVDKLPAGTGVVVDDARFPNEEDALHSVGALIVRIERDGAGTASVHASEQYVIDPHHTLHNNDTELDLFNRIDTLVRDWSWRDIKLASGLSACTYRDEIGK